MLSEAVYKAGILTYTLKDIDTSEFVDNLYVSLFMINDIDTSLISIFVPEVWEYPASPFVVRDTNGEVQEEISFPC